MAGRKRASDSESGPTTRASKAAKTDASATPSKAKGGKKGAKAALPASTFKTKALPLHVNLTHTPASIADNDTVPSHSEDPGFIGALTLLPSTFATGSYGWKGNKRITVELQNAEGGDEKEKVHVMLTINATVVGSKQAKGEEDAEEPKADEPEAAVEETADAPAEATTEAPAEANGEGTAIQADEE